MGKRAGKTELQFRLDTLMGLKAKGYNSSALIKAGQTAWGLSEREVQRYLRKIKEQEALASIREPCERLGQIDLRYQYLYSQAMAENNLALALEILKGQTQLEQTRSKTQQLGGHHGNQTTPSAIPLPEPNELERLVGLFQSKKPTSSACESDTIGLSESLSGL